MQRLLRLCLSAAALAGPSLSNAQPSNSGTLLEDVRGVIGERDLEGLLIKSSAGSVSAASLVGVDPSSLNVVDTVRDFSVLLNAFDPNAKAFGIAVTPARTKLPFPRVSLAEYGRSAGWRLVGNLTLSYAQGKTDEPGETFTSRAFSVATSGFWRAHEDPVVALAQSDDCARQALRALPEVKPPTKQETDREFDLVALEAKAAGGDPAAKEVIDAIRRKAAQGDPIARKEADALTEATLQRRVAAGEPGAQKELDDFQMKRARANRLDATAALKAFNDCAAALLEKLEARWNRSRFAVSFGTGSIKRSSGLGDSTSLGNTLAGSVLYGFDHVAPLRDRAAATLSFRVSRNEPVLSTLVSGVKTIDTSLVALRLSGGSAVFRGLAEVSNARSSDVTLSQRTFRQALGIDYRVLDSLWLNLRFGRQRKIDGSGNETGSFLLLNYSPSASLGR